MTDKKIVAVVGPTASGKTEMAVKLALEYGGEVISADSRQVYRGLDIGSGKIKPTEMRGVPHHLLDVADPAAPELFTLAEWLKLAREALHDIARRSKLPIVVGGTGLYVSALIEGYEIPTVPPNTKLRDELAKLKLEQLQKKYQAVDPEGFAKIDKNNPRRLIRAIEVVKTAGRPFFDEQKKEVPDFEDLILGIDVPFDELKKKIHARLLARMKEGMLDEVLSLHQNGVSWERLEQFGLEYKWMSKLARGEVNEKEALGLLEKEIIDYARRQLTWWRKKNVIWVSGYTEANQKVRDFLGA